MPTKTLEAVLKARETVTSALEDIQDSLQETIAATEAARQAFDDLDDELEEVEAELEDVRNDALGASGALTQLNASIEAIEGRDVKLDVDLSTASFEAEWAKLQALALAQPLTVPVRTTDRPGLGPVGINVGGASDSFQEVEASLSRAARQAKNFRASLNDAVDADGGLGTLTKFLEGRAIADGRGRRDLFTRLSDGFDRVRESMQRLASGMPDGDGGGGNFRRAFRRLGGLPGALEALIPTGKGAKAAIVGLVAVLATLGSIIGAVNTAITGLVSTFAVLGGGLLAQAEAVKEAGNLESTMAGLRVVFSNLISDLRRAISPLVESEAALSAFRTVLDGVVGFVNQLAQVGAELAPAVNRMVNSLEVPQQLFVELAEAGRRIMPIFAAALQAILNSLPGVVRWLRELSVRGADLFPVFVKLGAILGELVLAATDLIGAFSPLLNLVADILLAVARFVTGVTRAVSTAVRIVDLLVQKLDAFAFGGTGVLPGSGPTFDELDVDAGFGDSAGPQFEPSAGRTTINQYDYSTTMQPGSVQVDANPQDKARIKGLVNEAIRAANQKKRVQDGGV